MRWLKALLTLTLLTGLSLHPSAAQISPGLHEAALLGNLDAIQQHIKAGSDLDARDAFGSTPLLIAVTFGRRDVALALIDAGADLEARNSEGSTPLHVAALFGRSEIVRALLDSGANRYARDNASSTAFDLVAAPFEDDRWLYERLETALGPLGLTLDYQMIESARPRIAEMLRPSGDELGKVDYAPLPGGDWTVSTPADESLDPLLISELYLDAASQETLYGLLVIKNGHLIAEKYVNGGSVEQSTRLQSVTKSYTSALVGIALERGCLSGLDQKMLDFFPEVTDNISDPRKQQITVRHLLQMRAGFPWEETDPALWDGLLSGDYIPLIEEFPLVADPGTEFHYSNLTSNWLGIIVDRACGARLKAFGEEHLLPRIGARAGDWGTDVDGHNNGCADLHQTARDAARFGLLYLNDGKFDGEQVIAHDWVSESLKTYSHDVNSAGMKSGKVGRYFRNVGYGYQWWSARVGERDFNLAWGHGGQLIVLLHDLDMVVVVTSKPFYIQHNDEAWRHEKAKLNLVGKFISSLPVK